MKKVRVRRVKESSAVDESRPGNKPASLRPGWLARLIDRFVLSGSRLEERLEDARMTRETDSWERKRAVIVFVFLAGLYTIFGEAQHTSLFFATAGAVALGGKAWHDWSRRRWAKPRPDTSNTPQLISDTVAAVVAGLTMLFVMLVSMSRLPGGRNGVLAVAPVIAGALAYRRREKTDPAPEYTLFASGAAMLAVGALMALMYWGGGY